MTDKIKLKSMPVWGANVVSNHRAIYKSIYLEDSTLTNDEIWWVCENVFDDASSEDQDYARADEMRDMEKKKKEKNDVS